MRVDNEFDLQQRDEERIPELLGASETVTRAGEATLRVDGIRDANVDPNECNSSPAGEAVVALEEAARGDQLKCIQRPCEDTYL